MSDSPKSPLKNVLCERGFCASFAEARRLCLKGHVKVNDKACNDAEALIKTGDYIDVFNRGSRVVEIK